jgi:RHS repeat-associated protein
MPSRVSLTGKGYRFGFNGQERSDDIKGFGNSYTAQFWEYDSRIGRRWNLDPKPVTGISEYSAFSNNPILYSDPLGDTSSRPTFGQKGFVNLGKYKAGSLPYNGNVLNKANAVANNWVLAPLGNLAVDAVDAVANPGWALYNVKDFFVEGLKEFGKWSGNNPDRIAGVSGAISSAVAYGKENMLNPDAHLQVATMGWGVFGGSLIGSRINLSNDFTLKSARSVEASTGAAETGMSDLRLVTRAAQKAETAIGGIGRFAGSAKHTYANNLLSRYQSIYGNRGLQFNQYFNGPAGRGFLDVVNHQTMTIYDYKFGSAVMGNSQFQKYSNSFPGYSIQIIKP